jgi:hypothetical protein
LAVALLAGYFVLIHRPRAARAANPASFDELLEHSFHGKYTVAEASALTEPELVALLCPHQPPQHPCVVGIILCAPTWGSARSGSGSAHPCRPSREKHTVVDQCDHVKRKFMLKVVAAVRAFRSVEECTAYVNVCG